MNSAVVWDVNKNCKDKHKVSPFNCNCVYNYCDAIEGGNVFGKGSDLTCSEPLQPPLFGDSTLLCFEDVVPPHPDKVNQIFSSRTDSWAEWHSQKMLVLEPSWCQPFQELPISSCLSLQIWGCLTMIFQGSAIPLALWLSELLLILLIISLIWWNWPELTSPACN